MLSLVVAVPALVAIGLSWYYLPYYRLYQNLVWPAIFTVFVFAALVMALSTAQHRPVVAIVLILLVSPVLLVLVKEALLMRWEYVRSCYPQDFTVMTSHYQVELGTRFLIEELINGNKEQMSSVVKVFTSCSSRFSEKMLCVWETNFFMSVLQDSRVAMIKITKAQLCHVDLEADFRVFCFSEVLERQHKRFEELEYLKFWYVFEEAKALDRRSCHLLAALWSELSSSSPRYSSLQKLVGHVSTSIHNCLKKSEEALKSYKSSRKALTLIGTLKKDILNDSRGNEFLSRALMNKDETDQHYFSEEGSVIVVSGMYSRLGEILFVSEQAKDTLEIKNVREVLGMNINIFIPGPWARKHETYIKKFLLYSASNSVKHAILHLSTTKGYLVEVLAQIRVSYLHGNAFILIAFKKREHTREVILLGDNWQVLAHSEAVPEEIGLPQGLYNGADIETLFPRIQAYLSQDPQSEAFSYLNPRTTTPLRLRLVYEQYSRKQIRMLHILSEDEDGKLVLAHYDKNNMSQVELLQSMSILDLQDTRASLLITKKVGFNADTQFTGDKGKKPIIRDLEDPAYARKRREDVDKRTSIGSSATSSHMLDNTVYSNEDLKRVKVASFRLTFAMLCLVNATQMCFVISLSGACCGLLWIAASTVYMGDNLQLILRRGFYSARITTTVRQLQDLNETFPDADRWIVLQDAVTLYDKVFTTMKATVGTWNPGPALDYYTENRIITWEFWHGNAELHNRNLFDAMQIFIDEAKLMISKRAVDSSAFLYIYQNGLGETFTALNETNSLHLSADLRKLGRVQDSVHELIWCGGGVLIVLFITVVLPSIVLIERVHGLAWKRLIALKRVTLMKLRNDCHSRLEFHHKEDFTHRPIETQSQERRLSQFNYKWMGLVTKTSLYMLLSTLFLVLFWKLLCDPMFELLVISPSVLLRLEEQHTLLQTVFFWVRFMQVQETLFMNSTADMRHIVRYPQLHSSSTVALSADAAALKFRLDLTLAGFGNSRADVGFLLETPAGASNALSMGLHSAMNIFLLDIAEADQDNIVTLAERLDSMLVSLENGIDVYVRDVRTAIDEDVSIAMYVSVAYAVLTFLLFLLYYYPLINSIEKQVEQVWKLYRIIPQAELKAANRQMTNS